MSSALMQLSTLLTPPLCPGYAYRSNEGAGMAPVDVLSADDESALLTRPFQEDVRSRFVDLGGTDERFPTSVMTAGIGFVASIAEFRNLARF